MALGVTDICELHKTDKHCGEFPHSKVYDWLFAPLRDKPIRLLEIGVNKGGSQRVWEEYFSKAELFAIDIRSECKKYQTKRTKIDKVDQSSESELLSYIKLSGGNFDIIIDDGSHMTGHQITSFKTLWPFVRSKGIYIIEDIQTSNREEFINSDITCVQYFQGLIDILNKNIQDRPDEFKNFNTVLFKQDLLLVTKT